MSDTSNLPATAFAVCVMADGTIQAQPGLEGFGPEQFDRMIAAVVAVRKALGHDTPA